MFYVNGTQNSTLLMATSSSSTAAIVRQISASLNFPNFQVTQRERLVQLTQQFISSQQDVAVSPSPAPSSSVSVSASASSSPPQCTTELKSILAAISVTDFIDCESQSLEVSLLCVAKLLLRSADNRLSLGRSGVELIIKILNQRVQSRRSRSPVVAEVCALLLNACYDTNNVTHICESSNGVLTLLQCVHHRDHCVIAAALGALQAVCFAPQGRRTMRHNLEVLNKLSAHLSHPEAIIRARALGTIHNLSVDSVSITPLVNTGCIIVLIQMIQEENEEICSLALGTLQNLTRDIRGKDIACDAGALQIVANLIMSPFVTCQVAALGTLMNLADEDTKRNKASFHALLADAIALGAINACIFGKEEG